ncbi:hypothetical protein MRB53_006472 [Persea americana]|uniref:Uncharacterized protein n=1 Tax=Persea americana TaxID=3435 RepID=A0ACC2MG82_PERAE|nr:hypothetical protein MRB53_006472 [Persea americana]
MILRDSFSKAKKLFHNTIQTFKTMLSNGYERLPKTPPSNPFSCAAKSKLHHSFRDLDSFSNGRYGDDPDERTKKKSTTKKIKTPWDENKQDPLYNGSFMKFARANLVEEREKEKHHIRKQSEDYRKAGESRGESSSSFSRRVETSCAVTQRLKELELMDMSNVDHLLDIEEVLHYYSKITCPFYVDIVNKFFMEMYTEFLPQTSPQTCVSRHISNWNNVSKLTEVLAMTNILAMGNITSNKY